MPTWRVPLSDLLVDDEILEAIGEAAASGWWSMGPRVEEFETAFASYLGCRHAIAVSSGTAGIHLALLATGCGSGDEVVLPSLNFVAAANAVTHTGARPVLCDIRGAVDLNLDPEDVEAAIGASTKAILVLHYGGYSCDMDAVLDIARRHELVVIEDAAHAPGASWHGRMCGTLGDVGLLQLLLEQEPAGRRRRDGRHGRRRGGRPAPSPPLARHDHAHLGTATAGMLTPTTSSREASTIDSTSFGPRSGSSSSGGSKPRTARVPTSRLAIGVSWIASTG